MSYEQNFLCALLFTLVVEVSVVIVLLKYLYRLAMPISRIIFAGIVASMLTLPYLWFVLPTFIHNWPMFVIFGETAVVLTEAVIYKEFLNLKLTHAFIVSLLSNGASVVLGLLVL